MSNNAFRFVTTGHQALAFALAAFMTLGVLGTVDGLAVHYQGEAAYAAQQAAPASQQVVVVAQRARKV